MEWVDLEENKIFKRHKSSHPHPFILFFEKFIHSVHPKDGFVVTRNLHVCPHLLRHYILRHRFLLPDRIRGAFFFFSNILAFPRLLYPVLLYYAPFIYQKKKYVGVDL